MHLRFLLQERDNYITKKASVISCTRHHYLSSSSFLTNIIKLSQTVWELWPAQDFSLRGNNYITKKMRVVSHSHDTPIGPPLHSYYILSKQVYGYQSYDAHKYVSMNFCFKRDNYITKKLVSLARNTPTDPSLQLNQILSNYLKQYGSYGLRKIFTLGEINT